MRLVIVDDEALARERVRQLVSDFPGWEVAGEAENGRKALEVIRQTEPDVVLLDVRMGEDDGLQVARKLAEESTPPAIIFTTAFAEHALSAFESSAVAYLLKPIRAEKLRDALQRARRPSRAQLETAWSQHAEPARAHIVASTRSGLLRVPSRDILYFLADQKYVTVFHLHGEVLIEESLRQLEEDFAPLFVRIHRKALVAKNYITGLERSREGHHWVHLQHCKEPLPVSRRRLAEVRRVLSDGGGAPSLDDLDDV